MHRVDDIMKLWRPWMTAKRKLMRYRTNLSKTYDYKGLQDRLQDGVPETIADLKRAGIKI